MVNLWSIESELFENGYALICGVDEAGRGPLAGPVYAAAVILPFGINIPDLGDSKKLSEKTRDRLYDEIRNKAVDYAIGIADHKEIDELNILQATFLAMNRAVDALSIKPSIALIDGNRDPEVNCDSRVIVKGDSKSASIAAASILAKVSRDQYMLEMAEQFPQYSFEKHKGYGTKLHYDKLQEFGISEIHRRTFLKKMHSDTNADKTTIRKRGELGENIALEYLLKKGYKLVSKGYSSRFGEIDIIVRNNDCIVFAEVKLRKNAEFADAREHVTKAKQDKIKATASFWLARYQVDLQPRFDVIEIYMDDNTTNLNIIHLENAF